VSTPYEFAGTTTTFAQHTLKFTIQIQHWPFLALSNTLSVVFDANVLDQKASICPDTSNNLRWVLVVVDNVSLYPLLISKTNNKIKQKKLH
jgi:hypothetical protein